MSIQHGTEGRRRRAPSEAFLQRRAALELTGPLRGKLSAWQTRAVSLVAIGQRLRAHGQQAPSYASEVEALSAAVSHEQRLLKAQMDEAPSDIAAHGAFRDMQRALNSVAALLTEAQALLDGRSASGA